MHGYTELYSQHCIFNIRSKDSGPSLKLNILRIFPKNSCLLQMKSMNRMVT